MNTLRTINVIVVSLIVVILLGHRGVSQTYTAELSGLVSDPSGAVVIGAAVRAVNVETGRVTETRTNELGYYKFPYLPPATYQLEVEMAGFKKLVRKGIELHVNQEAQLHVTLEIGQHGDVVTVTAEAPLLDASSSALGAVISNQQILNLPLNNRQVYQLAILTPGVVPGGFSSVRDPARFNQAVGFSSQGAQRQTSKVVVDGLDVGLNANNPSFQGVTSVPSVDSVQEFKVQSNSFSAEFGRAGGGVINVVLKSGTNNWHSTAFEFLRNSKLDANNFFSNRAGVDLVSFKRNQFGGNLGGPVRLPGLYDGRNRTFFFFGFEGLRERAAANTSSRVPTELERAGDFSQSFNGSGDLIRVFDPFSTLRQPDGSFVRLPFAGNRIAAGRFNPVATKLLPYYALPTNPGAGPARQGNFTSSKTVVFDTERYDIKVDQNLRQAGHLMAKYSRSDASEVNPNFFGNIAGGGNTQPITTQNAAADYTHTLSPTLVVNAAFGGSRLFNSRTQPSTGFDVTTIGFPSNINAIANNQVFPRFTVNGFASLGNTADIPLLLACNMYTARGSVSKFAGRHSIKAGFEWQLRQVNHSQGGTTGDFTFNVGFTQGPDPLRGSPTAGNGFASLLLGVPASGTLNLVPYVSTQNHYLGFYLQDDLQLTAKLTMNLGVRYEVELPRTERYNRQTYWDLDVVNPLGAKVGLPLRGGLRFTGVDGNPRTPYDTDTGGYSPRVGFAYRVRKDTVIRAGYGLFFSVPPVGAAGLGGGNVLGFSANTPMLASVDGVTPFNLVSNPFPDGFIQPRGSLDGLLTMVGQNVSSVLRNSATPYMQQWNFNLQRQFRGDLLVEAAYAGSRGLNLQIISFNYDQMPDQALALGNSLNDMVANPFAGQIAQGTLAQPRVQRKQLLRPFPHFTNLSAAKPTFGQSTYHSFQVRVQKRFSSGLSFMLSYTNSKLMTNSDAAENFLGPLAPYQNFNSFRQERSVGAMDVSQRLVTSYTYELPVGRARKWGTNWNPIVNALLGGWQINGITTFQTGFPIDVQTQSNSSQSIGTGTQRPNSNGRSARMPGERSTQAKLAQWFDISTFSQPDPFTFGNVGRLLPDVRVDGTKSFDLSLFKNFRVGEKIGIQFRTEFFNAFNTPQFGMPNTSYGSATFGSVNGQANIPRQIQLGLKIYF